MSRFFIPSTVDGAPHQILVFDVIYDSYWEEDVTGQSINVALALVPDDEVLVRINCLGGSHKEGVAIYNALASHKGKVTVRIEGYACSMAVVIACAGDHVEMYETALGMTHKSAVWESGNADDLRAAAEMLDLADQSQAKAIARKTGKTEAEALLLLDTQRDTWHSADDMKAIGIVDAVIIPEKFSALLDKKGASALVEDEGAAIIAKALVPAAVLATLDAAPGALGYRITGHKILAMKTEEEVPAVVPPVVPPVEPAEPAEPAEPVVPPVVPPVIPVAPVAVLPVDPVVAERQRGQSIRAMAKKHGLQPDDDLVNTLINDGVTALQAGPMIMAVAKSIGDHTLTTPNNPNLPHAEAQNHGWDAAYKKR